MRIDSISLDIYNPGVQLEATIDLPDFLNKKLTPWIVARGKRSALTEYATGSTYGPHPAGDNPFNWGDILYAWWRTEVASGRGWHTAYFDTSVGDQGDYRFDNHPVSRALWLKTFGNP